MIAMAFLLGIGMGFVIGRAYSIRQVTQRETARYEFRMQLTRPLDLEPCEFTGFWQERP